MARGRSCRQATDACERGWQDVVSTRSTVSEPDTKGGALDLSSTVGEAWIPTGFTISWRFRHMVSVTHWKVDDHLDEHIG